MLQSSLHGYFAASKRPAPRDDIDMESLHSLRSYLDSESIEHDSSMPLEHLQMLVARRQKRRARECGEKPKKPKLDYLDTMKTLRGVRRAMARLSDTDGGSTDDKIFTKATFLIDTFPDQHLIKCKHHADWRKCRGNVEGGQCRQCRVFTPGVLNYSFQVLIRDRENANSLYVNISDRGGTSLFGMTAAAFNALAAAAREDAKARVVRVPVFGRMICAYDRADDYFNSTVYECTLLEATEGPVA
jgi:hypothetical protein